VALKSIIDFAYELGILTKLKNKLIAQPDPAAKHLAEIFGKIADSFEASNTELKNYLRLRFDANNPDQLAKETDKLIDLEFGSASARIEKFRIHCHEIDTIYTKYLDKWFKKTFNKIEYEQMEHLFRSMSHRDEQFFNISQELGDWLQKRARLIHDMIVQGNYTRANEEIQNDRKEISADHDRMVKTMTALYTAQGEFVKISKTI